VDRGVLARREAPERWVVLEELSAHCLD
jgi:hypothetical protein